VTSEKEDAEEPAHRRSESDRQSSPYPLDLGAGTIDAVAVTLLFHGSESIGKARRCFSLLAPRPTGRQDASSDRAMKHR